MPDKPRRPLVVIPALNEEETVGDVVSEVRAHFENEGIVVVDDGSIDDTAKAAKRAGAVVISHAVNLGVGGAMRSGFMFAQRNGYDAVIQVDGDGQHDPDQIDALLAGLSKADVVVGSRFGTDRDYAIGTSRRFAIRILSWAVSIHCRTKITDATSGFRAAGPRAVPLFAAHYPVEYLADTVDSLVLAVQAGLTIKEIPIQMHQRQGGAPSQSVMSITMHLTRSLFVMFQSFIRRVPAGARDLTGVDK